jgi:hypothetical protein
MAFQITISQEQGKGSSECLVKAFRQAKNRAFSKLFTSVRAEFARAIAEEIVLPIGLIKSCIRMRRIGADTIEVKVDSRGSGLEVGRSYPGIALQHFKPKRTNIGVSVHIKHKSGREVVSGAFIRKGKVRRRMILGGKMVGRYPIETLYTTAIEDIAEDKQEQISKFAQDKIEDVFQRQLNYEISEC